MRRCASLISSSSSKRKEVEAVGVAAGRRCAGICDVCQASIAAGSQHRPMPGSVGGKPCFSLRLRWLRYHHSLVFCSFASSWSIVSGVRTSAMGQFLLGSLLELADVDDRGAVVEIDKGPHRIAGVAAAEQVHHLANGLADALHLVADPDRAHRLPPAGKAMTLGAKW